MFMITLRFFTFCTSLLFDLDHHRELCHGLWSSGTQPRGKCPDFFAALSGERQKPHDSCRWNTGAQSISIRHSTRHTFLHFHQIYHTRINSLQFFTLCNWIEDRPNDIRTFRRESKPDSTIFYITNSLKRSGFIFHQRYWQGWRDSPDLSWSVRRLSPTTTLLLSSHRASPKRLLCCWTLQRYTTAPRDFPDEHNGVFSQILCSTVVFGKKTDPKSNNPTSWYGSAKQDNTPAYSVCSILRPCTWTQLYRWWVHWYVAQSMGIRLRQ